MRRASLLIVVFALVVAACAGGPDDAAAPVDGTPAPDFTLALGDGGEFTLSAAEKPVYLIFWAEW